MLRAIIIDDEIMGIDTLKVLIEENTKGLKIVATSTSPEAGIELIEDYKPDVVFLDISMPTMDGFELIERLSYKDFKLVFTTAHNEYAIKAIKNKARDYLLKPIDITELENCVATLVRESEQENKPDKKNTNLIELKAKNAVVFIKPEDIIRLEASGSYTVFYLANDTKEIVSKNLKECEALLIPSYFYRCHASHIINLHKVVKLFTTDGLQVQMSDGSLPEISRKNKEEFLERLKGI